MTTAPSLLPITVALASSLLLHGPLLAQTAPRRQAPPASPAQQQLEAMRQQISEQAQILENLRKALGEQDARYRELLQQVDAQRRVQEQQQARQDALTQQAQRPPPPEAPRTVQVGSAPSSGGSEALLNVPQLFAQPGVLTPKGSTIIEPSVQYGYSSSNRAALVGYTVIPAVLIGLVDVREVRRNSTTAAVTVRYGLTDRAEVEARLPYVYRSDSTVSREIFTGTATDSAFNATGQGIGDLEVTGRYQLNEGGGKLPYLIGSLRFKSRTGKDPFEVTTDCVTRCVGNATGTGQPLDLPTGSGFYTLQPGITWLYPSDPAVFFGSFTYAYNFKRSGVSRQVLGGEREFIGDVQPGNVFGFNVGMGLALNERSSFSMGVDVASLGRTKQNGVVVPGSVRTQLASLVLGYSFRYGDSRTINLAVGAGLTRDTPDLTLTLRVPFTD
ncbi:MAG: metA-pathway of phenol degradation family protein [Ramlibacter sp.]|nr:metA-pathway of phenol degradation family protein [Ramlibacter sp.]